MPNQVCVWASRGLQDAEVPERGWGFTQLQVKVTVTGYNPKRGKIVVF